MGTFVLRQTGGSTLRGGDTLRDGASTFMPAPLRQRPRAEVAPATHTRAAVAPDARTRAEATGSAT